MKWHVDLLTQAFTSNCKATSNRQSFHAASQCYSHTKLLTRCTCFHPDCCCFQESYHQTGVDSLMQQAE